MIVLQALLALGTLRYSAAVVTSSAILSGGGKYTVEVLTGDILLAAGCAGLETKLGQV